MYSSAVSFLLPAILHATIVLSIPAPISPSSGNQLLARDVTPISLTAFSAYDPYTEFARAAYCPSSGIKNWSCGEACDALPGFEPTLTGGDGDTIQLYFVGYWPEHNTVVVSHEGTDPTQFEADLTDADFFLADFNTTLFPGVDSSVQAHSGFLAEQALTAEIILSEVKSLIQSKGATSVSIIGHSLGGALAELDALYLSLHLPSSIHIKSVTYGTPRVGNPAYAALFDSKITDFVRINNEKDLIPTLPGRFLGFWHPSGEIHIVSSTEIVSCPGEDDGTDAQCTDQTVPNIFEGDILNHLGPYNGIMLGTIYCT